MNYMPIAHRFCIVCFLIWTQSKSRTKLLFFCKETKNKCILDTPPQPYSYFTSSMKTPGEQLFRIIKAMSPAEKRYFKRERGGEAQNRTLQLFDLINEQQEYDEEAIKRAFSVDASFVKNLKIHKNRLQQLVLKSLRSMHEEDDTPAKLRSMLADTDWLLKNRLVDLALQTIHKAKELCYRAEQYELLLVFLGLESRLSLLGKEYKPLEETPLNELLECNRIIENYVLYAHVNQNVLLHTYQVGHSVFANPVLERLVGELIERRILDADLRPRSFAARRMHNHIFALWNLFKGNYARSYEYTLASIEEFEDKPELIEEHSFSYLACLINHILASLRAEQLTHIQRFLDKGFAWVERLNKPELFGYLYYAQLRLNFLQGNYQKIYDYAREQSDKIERQLFSEHHQYMGLLLWASVCIMLDKSNEAGALLREAVQEKKDLPPACIRAGQLLELIYHTEQDDKIFVENQTQTYLKRLQRHGEHQPFFKWMLTLLRKLAVSSSSKARTALALASLPELSRFTQDPVFDFLSEVFFVKNWLNAQSQELKLADWLKKNRTESKTKEHQDA